MNTTPLFPIREVWPDVLVNLESLLAEAGEFKLAVSVDSLMVVDRCRSGADYCSIVHTQHWDDAGWLLFAQLREAFIMAVQVDFGTDREIKVGDLISSIWSLRDSTLVGNMKASTGFATPSPTKRN